MLNYQKIRGLIIIRGISRKVIAEKLNISTSTLSLKLYEKLRFNVDEIKLLSDLLNVSVDYLYSEDL